MVHHKFQFSMNFFSSFNIFFFYFKSILNEISIINKYLVATSQWKFSVEMLSLLASTFWLWLPYSYTVLYCTLLYCKNVQYTPLMCTVAPYSTALLINVLILQISDFCFGHIFADFRGWHYVKKDKFTIRFK